MLKSIFAAAVIGVIAATTAQAAVVQNGGFEQSFANKGLNFGQTFDQLQSGPGSSWDVFKTASGWTSITGAGIEIQSNRTLKSINGHDGQHYVELDSNNNSDMFQDVVLAVGDHVLSFFYSPRSKNAATNGIDFSVSGLLSGNVTGPGGVLGTAVGAWTEITQKFTVATAGTYTLGFAATGSSNSYGGLLDAVSITPSGQPVAPPAVPLPASVLLLGGGVAGLFSVRRRKVT